MPPFVQLILKHRGMIVPVSFVMLVMVIVVPLPPVLMDVLIAFNIALSVIILMTFVYNVTYNKGAMF